MFYTSGFGNFRGEINFFLLFESMEFFVKLRVTRGQIMMKGYIKENKYSRLEFIAFL